MYLIRLDDASEYMDVEKWNRVEVLLDEYLIKPIVGVIPNNQDADLVNRYQRDSGFWDKVHKWNLKGWTIAMHGYTHVYSSTSGGINPVNLRSEFAGLSLDEQKEKIHKGIKVFSEHHLNPKIFFAPSHTFDMNTLEALKCESHIKIISDTIANDIYKMDEFYFIPLQSGHVQHLPVKLTTFCCHPNSMSEKDLKIIKVFLKANGANFVGFDDLSFQDRKFGMYDAILRKLYFSIRSIRRSMIKDDH